jgi:polyisoprenoid-binding protein YceI
MLSSWLSFVAGAAASLSISPALAQTDEHQKTLADMPAGLYKSDNNHTHIYFTYSHVGFSNAHGRFDKFDGQLNFVPNAPATSSVSFTVDPASIDTNIPELEALLKGSGFFDVAKDPEMTFVSHGLARLNQNEGVLTGDLTMHGVKRPIELKVKLNKFLVGKELKFCRFGFTATGLLKRSDWGLGAVPLVGDDVTLDLNAEFTKTVGA